MTREQIEHWSRQVSEVAEEMELARNVQDLTVDQKKRLWLLSAQARDLAADIEFAADSFEAT